MSARKENPPAGFHADGGGLYLQVAPAGGPGFIVSTGTGGRAGWGFVLKALEPIWTVKPETSSRVRGRVESVLDWAAARVYREGDNPARLRGRLQSLLPKVEKLKRVRHHAVLPYSEAAEFIIKLRQQGGVAARALEFTILTGARTGEVIGAAWDEIALSASVWIIPADRMKGEREHRVSLTDTTKAILEAIALEHGSAG